MSAPSTFSGQAATAPRVSILVPCYNSAEFLAETLDSVLAQTFEDWECVAIDDASTDGTIELLRSYADRDPRIRPVALERNLGAAGARNEGLRHLRGRYLAFLDSDDLWHPEKLERQLVLADGVGAAMVHSSYRFVDETGAARRGGVLASPQVDLRTYLRNTEIGMSTSLLDREQVGPLEFRDIRLCQDTHLWLVLLRRGWVSLGLPEPLVSYRVRAGQISGSKLGMARQVWALYREIHEVPLSERLLSFACYAANGLRKRLRTPAFAQASGSVAGEGGCA